MKSNASLQRNPVDMKTLVACEVKDKIAHFVLTNPPANLMNEEWSRQAQEAIDQIGIHAREDSIRGAVVYSSGRHFSAGADLESLEHAVVSRKENYLAHMLENSLYFEKLHRMPVPVVAALRGVCIGSGLELALACHYRVCDARCVIGSVEATFGIMPGCGATIRLPRLIGTGRALEMVMTGKRINADEACALGIVDEVTHHDQLLARAVDYVERLYPWYRKAARKTEIA